MHDVIVDCPSKYVQIVFWFVLFFYYCECALIKYSEDNGSLLLVATIMLKTFTRTTRNY